MNKLKNKSSILFAVFAAIIAVVLFLATFYSLLSMKSTMEISSGFGGSKKPPIKFEFEKLKEMGIIK